MRTLAILVVGTVLITAGALRFRTYAQTRGQGAGYLGLAATCAGVAILLNAPAVYRWCDERVFWSPNSSVLASHVLTVIGAGAAGEMVAALTAATNRFTRRSRIALLATILVAIVLSFTVAIPSREDPFFFEHYKHDSGLLAYWCVFLGSVTVQLAFIANGTLRYTRHNDRWLGRGLRLIGWGCSLIALFLASRVIELAIPEVPSSADSAALSLLVVGGFLIAIGVLLPQIGMQFDRASASRALQPLWENVTRIYPQVRAGSNPPNLYRTVIEIQDALAEARAHGHVATPIIIALDRLPPRAADDFDATVTDLLTVARLLPSPAMSQ